MTEICSYHERNPAIWACASCGRNYCVTCFPGGEGNFGRSGARCPLCRQHLEWLGTGSSAPPFWRVTHRFFAYALRPQALGVMALVVLGSAIMPRGLLGFGMLLLLMAVVTRYAMTVIQRLSGDDQRTPGVTDVIGGDGSPLFFYLIAVLAIFSVFAWMLSLVSPWLGMVAGFVESGVLPASIMVLAITGSVSQAVNPFLLASVISRIGWSYLLLWLSVSTVTNGPYFVSMLMPRSGLTSTFAMMVAATFYFTVVAAAMMGYVLYHRSGELGLADAQSHGDDLSADDYERRAALGHANVYIQERRPDDARSALRLGLAKFPQDILLHERLHQLLQRTGDDHEFARHGDEYCVLLVKTRNAGKAAAAWLDVRQRVADFRPSDPAACEAIASFLHEQGRGKDALPLLINLHRRAPDYPDLPRAYLLLARLYVEVRGDTTTATRLLEFIRTKFPHHGVVEEAGRYAGIIARLGSAPTARGS